MVNLATTNQLKFDGQGLLPVVIQDWLDGTVLMLGYMNEEALAKTVGTKRVHFGVGLEKVCGKRAKHLGIRFK